MVTTCTILKEVSHVGKSTEAIRSLPMAATEIVGPSEASPSRPIGATPVEPLRLLSRRLDHGGRVRAQPRIWWLSVSFALALALPSSAAAEEPKPAIINLNTASLAQLMTLPGIGPRRAQQILRFRVERGFTRTSDLMRIKGIGRRTYARLKPLITVAPVPISRAGEQEAVNANGVR